MFYKKFSLETVRKVIRKGRTAARKLIGGLSPIIAEKLVIPKIVLVGMERRGYI